MNPSRQNRFMKTSTRIATALMTVVSGMLVMTPGHTQTTMPPSASPVITSPSNTDAPTTREEVFKIFQREAHAAWAEARKACESMTEQQAREVCIAKARLQFDADMRYAEQRANMGY